MPLGEYLTAQGLFERLSDTTAIVPRGAIPGRGTGLLRTPAGSLGVIISYGIFFADRARGAVAAGGQINAASFTTERVPARQVAASRMRARAFDRAVLQAAPTGYTAVVGPTGHVLTRGDLGTPDVLTVTVPLRSGLTVYARTSDGLVLAVRSTLLLVGPLIRAWLAGDRGRKPSTDVDSHAVPLIRLGTPVGDLARRLATGSKPLLLLSAGVTTADSQLCVIVASQPSKAGCVA